MLKWLDRRCFLTPWWGLPLLLVMAVSGATAATASADPQGLEARAKRYWAAETSQNYEAVYEMLTQGERDVLSRDDYVALRKVGGVRYLAAEIVEFAYDRELAWVNVKFEWVFASHAHAAPKSGSSWQLWQHNEGWHPVPLGERKDWPMLPPKLRPAAEEAALAERVIGYWRAKAQQDWRGVYGYLPPWFQDRLPLEKFLENKALYIYSSPTIEWVEVSEDRQGRARVSVGTRHNDPAARKMTPIMTRPVEPWVKVDGTWYVNVPPPDEPAAGAKESGKESGK